LKSLSAIFRKSPAFFLCSCFVASSGSGTVVFCQNSYGLLMQDI
jgi:hypothetical protein